MHSFAQVSRRSIVVALAGLFLLGGAAAASAQEERPGEVIDGVFIASGVGWNTGEGTTDTATFEVVESETPPEFCWNVVRDIAGLATTFTFRRFVEEERTTLETIERVSSGDGCKELALAPGRYYITVSAATGRTMWWLSVSPALP